MNIVLIDLPHMYLMQQRTQAPLGLMYLASVLEDNGYDVEIVRLIDIDERNPENYIPDADLYGISSTSLDYSSAKKVAKILKKRNHGKVIIGGYHATAETNKVINDFDEIGNKIWDAVCIGESENKIIEIAKDIEENNLMDLYTGSPDANLNLIPFPSRHLIRDQGGSIFAYDKHYTKNRLSTVISSSRGCPFNCCFCATHCMWHNKVRFRSAKNVMEEINQCISEYGIREFRFSDELFTVNKNRTMEMMKFFSQKEIYWKCSTRPDSVDEEVLKSMKNAGCKEIAFGIESADKDVLLAMNKKNDLNNSIKAMEICDKIGINTRALMMINTPGETIKTADLNISFLDKVPYTCASLSVFKPLPGSPVWKNPNNFGIDIINRDLDKCNIYMWIRGEIDENKSEDVFRILTLPSVESQIENRKKMIDYFYNNKKMNELERALNQKGLLLKKHN